MEKTRKTRKNPVYSLFQKIPSFGKLVLVLAMLFANIPLYRFYSAAGTVLPQLVTNFVVRPLYCPVCKCAVLCRADVLYRAEKR